MSLGNQPSSLRSTRNSAGTTLPEVGYVFADSGQPYDVAYLGHLSISAAADSPQIVASDPNRLEYGSVALSSIQQQVKSSGTTAAASAIATQTAAGTVTFAIREAGGASSLTVFVKTAGGATLSGFVNLGPII